MAIVNEKIKSYYNEILFSFGKLLRHLMYATFENNFENYWKAVYENAIDPSRENKDDSFFKGIRKHITDRNTRNISDDELFDMSLEWDASERIGIFDEAVLLKQIVYIPFVATSYRRKWRLTLNDKAIKGISASCNAIRNATAHFDASDPQQVLTINRFNTFIKDLKRLVSFCKSNNRLDETTKLLYSEFCRTCDELSENAGYPPIDADELSQEIGYNKDDIFALCKKNRIDYSVNSEDGKVYIISISKERLINTIATENINDKFNQLSSDYNAISNKFNQIAEIVGAPNSLPTSQTSNQADKQPVVATDRVKEEKTVKRHSLVSLKYLKDYSKGFLSDLQFEELCANYNFFADVSAFLSEETRRFITNVLVPTKIKCASGSCPIFFHRAARNEIYEIATANIEYAGLSKEEKLELEKQKENAKDALNRINELRHRGLLTIIGKPTFDESSTDMLLKMLEKYKDKRFCILTQESFFAEAISNTGTKTLSAIKVAASKPLVWSSTAENLKADHLEYVKSLNSKSSVKKGEKAEKSVPAPKKHINNPNKSEVELHESPDSISNRTGQNNNDPQKAIKKGDVVFDNLHNPTNLYNLLGKGGEGSVYETQEHDVVAKIYSKEKRTDTLEKKLSLMITKKPKAKNIAWPLSMLYDDCNNFVGFTMMRVPSHCKQLGETVLMINNEMVKEKYLSSWTRADLVKLCLSIVETFKMLHNKGILMGDINPANIMINPDKPEEVYFVDCDSYQIDKYLCTVGTPIFTSPNFYLKCNKKPDYSKTKRTPNDENYAVATLLFEILMNGQAPFASKSTEKSDIIEDICNHRFAFKTKDISGADTPDGPYRMIWNNLHNNCKNYFIDTFVNNKTISDDSWIYALKRYLMEIQSGNYTSELFPKKYMDFNGSFVDFKCTSCGIEANMHKEQYNAIVERANKYGNQPILLCNECKALMNETVKVETVNCEICGRKFYAQYGDLWRNQKFGFRIKCEECKNNRR